MTDPMQRLEEILDTHLNEIKAGHDSKLMAALRTWCLEVVAASVPDKTDSAVILALADNPYQLRYRQGFNAAIDQTLSNARKQLGLD